MVIFFPSAHANPTSQKQGVAAAITIVDQNGRLVPNIRPSATSQIFDVTVGPGGVTVFSPDTVNISTGDTVRWTWGSGGHSVTSGGLCAADSQFCSPDDMNCPAGILSGSGTVYQHTFSQAGTYAYFCAAHCARGMVGTINVAATCTLPPTGMAAWWPGEGNARDIQGGNNGTLQNGTTFAAGKVRQAFSFDGIDDRVEVANAANLNPTTAVTLDAWVNPQALTLSDSTVVAKSSESLGQRSYGMWITNDGRVHVEPSSLGTSFADTAPGVVPLSTWTHIAAVITAGVDFKIYVNGVQQSITTSGPPPTLLATTVPVTIGNSDLVARDWLFKGLIDEVELFDRALSQTEVQAIFNAGSAGKCKAPQPISAFSRKTHGGSGTFDIDLNSNGTPGVECRSGGGSGVYQMIVQFANPVTVTGATLTGIGSVSSFSVSGAMVTIDLSNIANAQTLVVRLTGVSDGTLSGNVPVAMSVLVGDTNGNGTVSASDVAQTKAQSGNATVAGNFREDVNASGSINAGDVALVKSKTGTSLPP